MHSSSNVLRISGKFWSSSPLRLRQRQVQGREIMLAPDKARQPAGGGGL